MAAELAALEALLASLGIAGGRREYRSKRSLLSDAETHTLNTLYEAFIELERGLQFNNFVHKEEIGQIHDDIQSLTKSLKYQYDFSSGFRTKFEYLKKRQSDQLQRRPAALYNCSLFENANNFGEFANVPLCLILKVSSSQENVEHRTSRRAPSAGSAVQKLPRCDQELSALVKVSCSNIISLEAGRLEVLTRK